jgi:uncharacterized protein (DUF4213/DUF364 family)
MEIYNRIQELLGPRAAATRVDRICIGLGYSAVVLEDGGVGIAFTYIDGKESCSLVDDRTNYEGRPSKALLNKLWSPNPVERSVGVAAVNALNHARAARFRNDQGTLLDDLAIASGDRVAMVGYFGPVAAEIEARGATVFAYDIGKGMGEAKEFYRRVSAGDATAMIVTSTSIVGGSTEELLSRVPRGVRVVMLGPTTPMIPEAFSHLPVSILGGTLPMDTEGVLEACRHAKGTKALRAVSRKVYHRVGIDPPPPWP